MTKGPNLPYELLTMIVTELDSPHRNALHPLLTVSHAVYDVVAPLIYQSIVFDRRTLAEEDRVTKGFGCCTWVSPDQLVNLTFALKHNSKNARSVTTLLLIKPFPKEVQKHNPEIYTTLSYMPCIQRLYLASTFNHVLQSVLDALPRSVGLTHLSVPVLKVVRTHILVDMRFALERHRSTLRFISCKDNASYLTKYLNSSMKVLDTVNNDHPSDWGTLIDFAPIKYLSTAILPACIKDPRSVFFNIVALKISRLASHDVLPMYAPHLVRVRILHLGVVDVGSTSAEINIRDLMGIPSPFLSYIHICRLENSPNRSEAEGPALPFDQLFDRHLSLRAVDVTHAIKDTRKGPYFRHVRGSDATKEVNIHLTGVFENWWEPAIHGLNINL